MSIKYPILLLAVLTLADCSQDVPIKQKGYGFSIGDPYGTLHIQFFLDFQCPDSKESFQVWRSVRKQISLQQNKIKLTFQFNPLPYHFFATYIHEAFFYVLKNAGPIDAEDFMNYVFQKQQSFTQQVYINKTSQQFVQEFSQKIATLFNLNQQSLAKQMAIGSDSFKELKDHWRYTTITKGVSGAPIFFANGVLIDGAEEFGFSDWLNFIKQYHP